MSKECKHDYCSELPRCFVNMDAMRVSRSPLTTEEIDNIAGAADLSFMEDRCDIFSIARGIERAHGIDEQVPEKREMEISPKDFQDRVVPALEFIGRCAKPDGFVADWDLRNTAQEFVDNFKEWGWL